MIISVVMKVENTIKFVIDSDVKFISVFNSLGESLPRVLFHLDVVELPVQSKKYNEHTHTHTLN